MEWFYSIGWTGWILLGACAYVFGLPLLILSTFRHEVKPTLELIDLEQMPLPPLVGQQFDAVQTEMESKGFEAQGTLFMPQSMENVRSLLRVFANRTTHEAAMAASVFGLAQGQVTRSVQYVEFCTRYVGGKEFNTGNSSEIGAFPSHADTTTAHFPRISDVPELYRIHQAITSAKGPAAPKVLRLDTKYGGGIAEYIAGCMQEELERAREAGYVRLARSNTHYRATVKGAYMMTWKQLPPFKYVVAYRRRQKGEALLAEIGYR